MEGIGLYVDLAAVESQVHVAVGEAGNADARIAGARGAHRHHVVGRAGVAAAAAAEDVGQGIDLAAVGLLVAIAVEEAARAGAGAHPSGAGGRDVVGRAGDGAAAAIEDVLLRIDALRSLSGDAAAQSRRAGTAAVHAGDARGTDVAAGAAVLIVGHQVGLTAVGELVVVAVAEAGGAGSIADRSIGSRAAAPRRHVVGRTGQSAHPTVVGIVGDVGLTAGGGEGAVTVRIAGIAVAATNAGAARRRNVVVGAGVLTGAAVRGIGLEVDAGAAGRALHERRGAHRSALAEAAEWHRPRTDIAAGATVHRIGLGVALAAVESLVLIAVVPAGGARARLTGAVGAT